MPVSSSLRYNLHRPGIVLHLFLISNNDVKSIFTMSVDDQNNTKYINQHNGRNDQDGELLKTESTKLSSKLCFE